MSSNKVMLLLLSVIEGALLVLIGISLALRPLESPFHDLFGFDFEFVQLIGMFGLAVGVYLIFTFVEPEILIGALLLRLIYTVLVLMYFFVDPASMRWATVITHVGSILYPVALAILAYYVEKGPEGGRSNQHTS